MAAASMHAVDGLPCKDTKIYTLWAKPCCFVPTLQVSTKAHWSRLLNGKSRGNLSKHQHTADDIGKYFQLDGSTTAFSDVFYHTGFCGNGKEFERLRTAAIMVREPLLSMRDEVLGLHKNGGLNSTPGFIINGKQGACHADSNPLGCVWQMWPTLSRTPIARGVVQATARATPSTTSSLPASKRTGSSSTSRVPTTGPSVFAPRGVSRPRSGEHRSCAAGKLALLDGIGAWKMSFTVGRGIWGSGAGGVRDLKGNCDSTL
eukprot:2935818-Pleurochrysis_carterae.AAC.3